MKMQKSISGLLVAAAISLVSSCGVTYQENGFGGGCHSKSTTQIKTEKPTMAMEQTTVSIPQLSAQILNENAVTVETQNNLPVSGTKLTFTQKIKLVRDIKKQLKNVNPNTIKDIKTQLAERKSLSNKIKNDKKSGIDTSTEGLLKLILLILLALLIVGLLQKLLGSGLVSLLALILLIYLILVYL